MRITTKETSTYGTILNINVLVSLSNNFSIHDTISIYKFIVFQRSYLMVDFHQKACIILDLRLYEPINIRTSIAKMFCT